MEDHNQDQRTSQHQVFCPEKIEPEEWCRQAEAEGKQGQVPKRETSAKEDIRKYRCQSQPQGYLKEQALRQVIAQMLREKEVNQGTTREDHVAPHRQTLGRSIVQGE